MTGIRFVGDHGLLIELEDNATVHAVARAARRRFGDQLAEVVPGHRTLLLVWHEGSAGVSGSELADLAVQADPLTPGELITVPVRYDGADLDHVAARLGISPEAVVRLHSAATYTVAFTGFAPGFPYLQAESRGGVAGGVAGSDAEVERLLALPRLETPRTVVPQGSVAVAAGYCGIYPWRSPGGWNLLGRTDLVPFDPERESPALLAPGMRVRFEPR